MPPDPTIHPTAFVAVGSAIGAGTKVWHHAQVREDAHIGKDCIIGKNVYVDVGVRVGDRVKVQNNSALYHGAIIEDWVFVGPSVILTNDDVPRAVTPGGDLKGDNDWDVCGVTVRRGASLGAGAVVLPGVEVGAWALVGAGSVVTHDVPPHGLVFGNPARLVGYVCRCGKRRAASFEELTCDCFSGG